jgi:uncharacterized protein YndB with AHSA1/START domain
MPGISGSIIIDRPIEEVFDFVIDERNEPLYNPELLRSEKLTDGPIGVGTKFRASHRQGRHEVEMAVEVTGCDRPRRIGSETAMPWANINGELTFEPIDTSTKLRWDWEVHPKGYMRALTPLIGFIGRRSERACWEGLMRYVETHPASS